MTNYALFIDGRLARSGAWDPESSNESFVAFGDASYGGGVLSRAEWDYARFGVVPEVGSAHCAICVFSCLLVLRRKMQ